MSFGGEEFWEKKRHLGAKVVCVSATSRAYLVGKVYTVKDWQGTNNVVQFEKETELTGIGATWDLVSTHPLSYWM